MLSNPPRSTEPHAKALRINLDPTRYGTFAEIGAGQEVARWFFRVGGAAGTIAKSVSAYDMTVSDAIYGFDPGPRLRGLYRHVLDRGLVRGLGNFAPAALPVFSRDVLERIGRGDERWQDTVPAPVAALIRERGAFGFQPPLGKSAA